MRLAFSAQEWPKPNEPGKWSGSCGIRYEGAEGRGTTADGDSRANVSSSGLLSDFSRIV